MGGHGLMGERNDASNRRRVSNEIILCVIAQLARCVSCLANPTNQGFQPEMLHAWTVGGGRAGRTRGTGRCAL